MSKSSSRARYEAFTEWYKWAQQNYPILKLKKKPKPEYSNYGSSNEH